jgi:hypothetical protein
MHPANHGAPEPISPVVALPGGPTGAHTVSHHTAGLEGTGMRQSQPVTLPGINIQAPLGGGHRVRAQGDRDAFLPHAEEVGRPATGHY